MTLRAQSRTPSIPAPPWSQAVRVLCVDDHALLIEGLKAQFAISARLVVVGTLSSADSLAAEYDRLRPDVVLLDVEMPGADSFEAADRLRHAHPNARVVFLSAHIRDGYISAAYKCGALGYFAKSDDLDAIVQGLLEIAANPSGAFVLGPKIREHCRPIRAAAPFLSRPSPRTCGTPRTPLDSLTTRELEVLRLIGKGHSRGQIASDLSRSAKTIDGHQERIMRKLGISSRADLVRLAIREGLAEA
ncbi:Transcriptional regulatory protein DegU [Phycisphaerales bacterium]|nr:Transcriptional regulatory protein DegU [Phycisphaerales bacterium]